MQPFSVEHIVPLSAGGGTDPGNLAFACQGCNGHKHAKVAAADPITGREVALFHPRTQRWNRHFAWTSGCLQIVGLTPAGRATVEALKLNRATLVALRRLLRDAGEHPPTP